MGKVIIFSGILYDGNYRCYHIDDKMNNHEEIILFNDNDAPIEVGSVMNIETKYIMTLVFTNTSHNSENYVNIEFDMPDIRVQYEYTKLKKTFSKIILRKRSSYVYKFHTFLSIQERFPILGSALDLSTSYTTKNKQNDDFITSYICNKIDLYKICPQTIKNINLDIQHLNEKLKTCEQGPDNFENVKKNRVNRLNNDIESLLKDIARVNATWSYGEILLVVLFGVGIVMFLLIFIQI